MDSKNSILLIDPAFELSTTNRCSLLIKVSADNFSYAIVDETEQKISVLYDQQECDYPAVELFKKIESEEHLAQTFKSVKIAVHTPNTVTVPNDLFDPNLLNEYGKYFTVQHGDKLHLTEPEGFDCKLLFTIEPSLYQKLTGIYPNCILYNHYSPLLELTQGEAGVTLNLDFTVGTVNAAVLNDGRLQFHNSFEIEDAGELNYYLVFIANQLKVDLSGIRIFVSGIIHEGDKLHAVLSQYTNDITFLSPLNTALNEDIISDLPGQYYCSLLALAQCG